MPDGGEPVKVKVLNDIAEIEPAEWDACAGQDNPFVSHGFLRILEQSGSVSGRTGWLPQHLAIEDDDGRLIGAIPCYLKSHSYGEYVFDWGWADAFERAGGKYYPKLQISVPFTPVAGPRLMVRPGSDEGQTRLMLAAGPHGARQEATRSRPFTSPSAARTSGRRWAKRGSCSAWASSSTGTTGAMNRSTTSSPGCPRANGRRSARNAARRMRAAWKSGR